MDNATLEAPAQTEELTDTLTTYDRCDACGSQAYVRVEFTDKNHELLFCSHHYKSYAEKLATSNIKVINESHKLSDKRLDVSA
jgi:hypothetical protein